MWRERERENKDRKCLFDEDGEREGEDGTWVRTAQHEEFDFHSIGVHVCSFICVCECVHMRMHVLMSICVCIHMCMCVHVCIHISMCMRIFLCEYACKCMFICGLCMYS